MSVTIPESLEDGSYHEPVVLSSQKVKIGFRELVVPFLVMDMMVQIE